MRIAELRVNAASAGETAAISRFDGARDAEAVPLRR
jgi:hypothetical protein